MKEKIYTQQEELLNTLTHAFGIVFGIAAGVYLLQEAYVTSDLYSIASVWIYIVCMLSSYVTSTLYHSAREPQRKALLRRFDHAAIYWHIAGSYTPFTLIVLREVSIWGWLVFSIVWIAAILGTILSFTHQKAGSKLETVCYVLMGCVIVIAIKPLADTLAQNQSLDALYWLLAGGASYIIGAVLYSIKKVKYMHTVFHLFVLGGSVCHVVAINAIFN